MRIDKKIADWLRRVIRRRFAKWPIRQVRYPVHIVLSNDHRLRPYDLNDIVRQAGYTNGDRMVVMLESDFQRVANLAHNKIKSPLVALLWYHSEYSHLDRISSSNNDN